MTIDELREHIGRLTAADRRALRTWIAQAYGIDGNPAPDSSTPTQAVPETPELLQARKDWWSGTFGWAAAIVVCWILFGVHNTWIFLSMGATVRLLGIRLQNAPSLATVPRYLFVALGLLVALGVALHAVGWGGSIMVDPNDPFSNVRELGT